MGKSGSRSVASATDVGQALSMVVTRLYVQPERGDELIEMRSVTAVAGLGLLGDCHGSLSGPRQVLIAGEPSIRGLRLRGDDLQANIVLSENIESLPSGTVLRFGDVFVRLTILCEPCAKLERVRSGLARESKGRRGYLGRVLGSGVVAVGDDVITEARSVRALDCDWKIRIADIAAQIPRGAVLRTSALAKMAGVDSIYCRAIPRVLVGLAREKEIPIHRVIPSDPARISPEDRRRLRREGVDTDQPLDWDGSSYYGPEELAYMLASESPLLRAANERGV